MLKVADIHVGLDVAVHDWNGRNSRPTNARRAKVVGLPEREGNVRVHYYEGDTLAPYEPYPPFERKSWPETFDLTAEEQVEYQAAHDAWVRLRCSQENIRAFDVYSTWADYLASA